ncbi:fap1 adhesin-like isoform X2 [Narcine bancroftii]|uniref:fap1 adhesin-like isoform X2 n=1 Tax=Narcine bancroftii TaxID=1343680 RepID=UPI0038323218
MVVETTVGDLEKVKESLTAKMDQILEDQRHLMQMKLALSLEVATYRALLNSEADRMNLAAGYRDVELGFPSGKGPSRLGSGYIWRTRTVSALGSRERDDVAEPEPSASRGDKVMAAGTPQSAAGGTGSGDGTGAGKEPEERPKGDRGPGIPSRDETAPREGKVPETKLLSKPERQPPPETEQPQLDTAGDTAGTPLDAKGSQPAPPFSASPAQSPEPMKEERGDREPEQAAAEKKLDGDQEKVVRAAADEQKPAGEVLGEKPAAEEIAKVIVSSEAPRTQQRVAGPGKEETVAQGVPPGGEDASKPGVGGSSEMAAEDVPLGAQREGQPSGSSREFGGEVTGAEEPVAAQRIQEELKSQERVAAKEGSPVEGSSKLPADPLPAERNKEGVKTDKREDVSVETAAGSAKESLLEDKKQGVVTSIANQHLPLGGLFGVVAAREEIAGTNASSDAAPTEQPVPEREDETAAQEVLDELKPQEATVCGDEGGSGEGAVEKVPVGVSEAKSSTEPGPQGEPPSESDQGQGGEVAVTEEPDAAQPTPGEPGSKAPIKEKETVTLGSSPEDSVQEQPEEKVVPGRETREKVPGEPCVAVTEEEKLPEEKEEEGSPAEDQHVSAGEESVREEIAETIESSKAARTEQPVAGQEDTAAPRTSVAEEAPSPGDSVQKQPEEEVVPGTETKKELPEEPCVEETAEVTAEERFDQDLEEEVTPAEDQHVSAGEVICDELLRKISETKESSEAAPTEQPVPEREEETAAQEVLDELKPQEATVCGDEGGSGEGAVEEVPLGVSEAKSSAEPGPQGEPPSESDQGQGGEGAVTEEPDAAQPTPGEPGSKEAVTKKETVTLATEEGSSLEDCVLQQPEEEVVPGTDTKEEVSGEPCVKETAEVSAEEEKILGDKDEAGTPAEEHHLSTGEESVREEIAETIERAEAVLTEQPVARQEEEDETVAPGASAAEEITSPGDSVREQPEEEVVPGTEIKEEVSGEQCVEEMAEVTAEEKLPEEPKEEGTLAEEPHLSVGEESVREEITETIESSEAAPTEKPVAGKVEEEVAVPRASAAKEMPSPRDSVQEQPEEEVVPGTETEEEVSGELCVEETAAVSVDQELEVTPTEDQHLSVGEVHCEEPAREKIAETIESSEAAQTEQPVAGQEEETVTPGTLAPKEVSSPEDFVLQQPEEEVVSGTETKEDVSGELCMEETTEVPAEEEKILGDKEEEVTPAEDQLVSMGEESVKEEIAETIERAEAVPTEQLVARLGQEEEMVAPQISTAEETPSPRDSVQEQPEERGEKEVVPGTETKEEVPEEPCVEETAEVTAEVKLPEENEKEGTPAEDQHVSAGEESAREEIAETSESAEVASTKQLVAGQEKEMAVPGTSAAEEVTFPGDFVQEQLEEEVVPGTETKEQVSGEPCMEETAEVTAEERFDDQDLEEEVTPAEDQHVSMGEELVKEEIAETIESSEAVPTEQPVAGQEKEEMVAQEVLDEPKPQEATMCGDEEGSGEGAVEEVPLGASEAEPSTEPEPQGELASKSDQEQGEEVTRMEEPDAAQPTPGEPESKEPVTKMEMVTLESSAAEGSSPKDSVLQQPEEEVIPGTETKEEVSVEPCVEEMAEVPAEEEKILGDKEEEEETLTENQHVSTGEELVREEISETIESSEAALTEQPVAEPEEEEAAAQGTSAAEEAPSLRDSVQEHPEEEVVPGTETKEGESGEPCVEETAEVTAEEKLILGDKEEEVTPAEDQLVSEGEESAREEIAETIESSEAALTEQPVAEPEEEEAAAQGTSAAEEAPSLRDSVQEHPEEEVVPGTETKEGESGEPCVEETAEVTAEEKLILGDKEEEVTPAEDQLVSEGEESAREEIAETIESSESVLTEQPVAEPEEEAAAQGISAAEEAPSLRDSVQEKPEERGKEEVVPGTETKEEVSGEPCMEEMAEVTAEEKLPEEPEEEVTPAEDQHVSAGEESVREEITETIESSESVLTEQPVAEPKEKVAVQGISADEEAPSPRDSVQEQLEERGKEEVVPGTETKEEVSGEPCMEEMAEIAAEEKLPEEPEEEVTLAEDQHMSAGEESARAEILETIESSEASPTEQLVAELEEEAAAQGTSATKEEPSPRDSVQEQPEERGKEEVGPGTETKEGESGEPCVEEMAEVAVEEKLILGVKEEEVTPSEDQLVSAGEESAREEIAETIESSESVPTEQPVAEPEEEVAAHGISAAEEAPSSRDSVQEQPEEKGKEEVVLGTETKAEVSGEPCMDEMAEVTAEEKLPEVPKEEVTPAEDQHVPAGEESVRAEILETIESSEAAPTKQPVAELEKEEEEEAAAQGTSAAEEVPSPRDSVQEQPEDRGKEEVGPGTETKEEVSEELSVEETAAVSVDQEQEVTPNEDQHLSVGEVHREEPVREEISETILSSVKGQDDRIDQEGIPAEVAELEAQELVCGQEGGSACDVEGGLADEDLPLVRSAPLAQPEQVEDEEKFGENEADGGEGAALPSEEVLEPALTEGMEEEQSRWEDCMKSPDVPSLDEDPPLRVSSEEALDTPSQPTVSPISECLSQAESPEVTGPSHTPPSQTSEVQGDASPCEEEHPNMKPTEDGLPGGSSEPGPRDEPVPEEGSDSDGAGGLALEEGGLQTEVCVKPVDDTQAEEEAPETPIDQQTGEENLAALEHEDSPKDVQTPSNLLQVQGDIPAATPSVGAWQGDSNGVEVAEQEGSPGEEEVEGRLVSRLEASGPGNDSKPLTEDQETSSLQGEADQSYKGQSEPCGPQEESKEDSSIACPLDKIDSSIPNPRDSGRGSEEEGEPCRGEELGTLRESMQICEDIVERVTSPKTHQHLETHEDERLPGEDFSLSAAEGMEEGGNGGSVDPTLSPLPLSPAQDTTPADIQDPRPVIPALPEDQPMNGLHDCCKTLGKGEGRTVEMIATAYHYCSSEDE